MIQGGKYCEEVNFEWMCSSSMNKIFSLMPDYKSSALRFLQHRMKLFENLRASSLSFARRLVQMKFLQLACFRWGTCNFMGKGHGVMIRDSRNNLARLVQCKFVGEKEVKGAGVGSFTDWVRPRLLPRA